MSNKTGVLLCFVISLPDIWHLAPVVIWIDQLPPADAFRLTFEQPLLLIIFSLFFYLMLVHKKSLTLFPSCI